MTSISIATWNVLADAYAMFQDGVALEHLVWEERRTKIEKCIVACCADILCLQEIDHYDDFYKEFLDHLQFQCIYIQRPNKDDGCLVAWKKDKFELAGHVCIDFDDIRHLISVADIAENYVKNNVGIIAKLRCKDHERERESMNSFVVGNVHIFWNPARPEVKLAQTRYLQMKLREFVRQMNDDDIPIIVTGDFNSLPDSEVYRDIISLTNTPHDFNLNVFCGNGVKFICDANLSRLCRWMRVLGLDTALESPESAEQRAGKPVTAKLCRELFERARIEERVKKIPLSVKIILY